MSFNPNNSMNMLGNGNLNSSGTFPGLAPGPMQIDDLRRLTPDQLAYLQQINQQQIQQLTTQMANIQVAGTTPGSVLPTTSPLLSPTSPAGTLPLYLYPGQGSIPTSPSGLAAQFVPATGYQGVNNGISLSPPVEPLQASPLNVSNTAYRQTNGNNTSTIPNNTLAYPNSGINDQLRTPAQGPAYNDATIDVNMNGSQRNATVPTNLPLQQKHTPTREYSNSTYSSSSASTPQHSPGSQNHNQNQPRDVPDGAPTFMHRPRQIVTSPPSGAPPPLSDASSTSSASIPGSPHSAHSIQSPDSTWSDASPGPTSPDYLGKVVMNGDLRSPTSIKPIKSTPLQIQTRYPQDKCYSCMKKVYPMEKLGPVRGVVYHKGCFRCKVCQTQLTLKNFFHSQSDSFDLAVYCKSHQPIRTDKAGSGLDSESFEIKAALKAPKQGKVIPESERVPVKNFHMDMNSREIEHARKVPVANLQSGNKVRSAAWSKSKREVFQMPPQDVVRHDEPVPEYDPVSYGVYQVETNPDY